MLAVQLARHSCAVSALPRACDRREPVLQLHPASSQDDYLYWPSFWSFSVQDQASTYSPPCQYYAPLQQRLSRQKGMHCLEVNAGGVAYRSAFMRSTSSLLMVCTAILVRMSRLPCTTHMLLNHSPQTSLLCYGLAAHMACLALHAMIRTVSRLCEIKHVSDKAGADLESGGQLLLLSAHVRLPLHLLLLQGLPVCLHMPSSLASCHIHKPCHQLDKPPFRF